VLIRERGTADLGRCVALLRVVHEADRYPLNWPDNPAQWLTPAALVVAWVAELPGGDIAGHVALQRNAAGRVGAEVSRLFVGPEARRRSVAATLLAHATSWAAEHGLPLTLTVTDEDRSGAVAFYEAAGWHHTATTTADWTAPDGRPVRLRHYAPRG